MKNLKKCVLHIGLHKTGTTQIQMLLQNNNDLLRRSGVSYMKYDALHRTAFTRQYVYGGRLAEGSAWLNTQIGVAETAFLSNESFLGQYADCLEGVVYPNREVNLRNLVSMLPKEVHVDVFLSIRNYWEWCESAYLQFIKIQATSPLTFLQYMQRMDMECLSWFDLVTDLLKVDGVNKFYLWAYEDFRRSNESFYRFFDQYLNVELNRLPPESQRNSSYSVLAHQLLLASGGMKKEDYPKFRSFLRKNFKVTNGYPKASFFSEDEKLVLNHRYENDLLKIQAIADGRLSFLTEVGDVAFSEV